MIVNTFASSVQEIEHLHGLPLKLTTYPLLEEVKRSQSKTTRKLLEIKRVVETFKKNPNAQALTNVNRELKLLTEKHKLEVRMVDGLSIRALQQLHKTINRDRTVASSIQSIFFACALYAWASFESVVKDLWIAAVNARPVQLGERALTEIPDERKEASSLTRKQISVGLLARCGFDLRFCLGTLLADKYEFTGLPGMRAAYFSAFADDTRLKSIFNKPILNELEATRHLIAHRAGIVDEEFRKKTNRKLV